jgi:hypothetical protein
MVFFGLVKISPMPYVPGTTSEETGEFSRDF